MSDIELFYRSSSKQGAFTVFRDPQTCGRKKRDRLNSQQNLPKYCRKGIAGI
tara:strand:+ start:276 stop:431 length:156 start_codon:yes stop_codon:yes gene_type:complete